VWTLGLDGLDSNLVLLPDGCVTSRRLLTSEPQFLYLQGLQSDQL
jgi:hypothetical protein